MNRTSTTPRSTRIDLPEGQLRVLSAGDHGSPVLLLSGAAMDSATLSWKHLIPVLAENHRVFALDWPKQGESRNWRGPADHGTMLRCITEVLDHFGLETVALVGLSQGGALTLAYTLDHPERVAKFVAIAPGGIVSFPPVIHQALWLSAKFATLQSRVATMLMRKRSNVALMARKGLFAGPVADFDDVVDEIHAEAIANGAGASDWQNASIGFRRMHVDLRPRLREIFCPALFIQGEEDIAIRPRHTIAAAHRVSGSRLELLPGHGHWPNRQSPELVNRMIADFLVE